MNTILRKVIAGSSLLAVSFNASAFPIMAINSIGYLVPILLAIVSGGVGIRNKKHMLFAMVGMLVLLTYFIFENVVDHRVEKFSLKQKYFESSESVQINSDRFLPIAMVPEVINSGKRVSLIKIQDVRNIYLNNNNTYGYAEYDKAIDYINANKFDYVLLRSHSYQTLLDFGEKVAKNANTKVMLVKPELATFNCEQKTCAKNFREYDFEDYDFPIIEKFNARRAKLLDDFNIVVASRFISSISQIYKEDMIYLDVDLAYAYGDKYWSSISTRINRNKKTIVLINKNDNFSSSESFYNYKNGLLNILSEQTGVKDFYVTSNSELIREISLRSDDPVVTKSHINENRYYSPIEIHARSYSNFDYFTYICFTEQCVDTMGRDNSINASKLNIFSLNGSLLVNLEPLKRYKNDKLVIASHDLFSSLLGKLLAKNLADNGFKFKGFTYHYSMYFGAFERSVINGEHIASYDDNILQPLTKLLSAINYEFLDKDREINIYALIVVSLIFGALSVSKNGNVSKTSSVGFIVISYILVNFFHLNPKLIDLEIFGVLFAAPLLATYIYVTTDKCKYAIFSLIAYWLAYSFISVSSMINYVLSFYSIGGVLAIAFSCKKIKEDKARIGEKYLLTVKHLTNCKAGWIIENKEDLLRHIKNKKYLLRSNHLTKEEMDVSGKFESYLISGKEDAMKVYEAAIKDANILLKQDDIQFWLVPYVETTLKGVMQSIGTNIGLVGISLGANDSVTLGTSSSYYEIDREGNCKNWSDSKITKARLLKKLKEIEAIEGVPVIVEFGITRFGKIEIFQVRHQCVDYSHEQTRNALNGRYSVVFNESSSILGASVLSSLSEGRIVLAKGSMSMLKVVEPNQSLSYIATQTRLVAITKELSEIDLSNSITINAKVNLIKQIIDPIITLYFSGSSILFETVRDSIILNCVTSAVSKFGELPGYDLADKPVQVSTENSNLSSTTYKDVLHLIVSIALIRLRNELCSEFTDISRVAGSTISQLDEKIFIEDTTETNNMNEMIVVVEGSFSGETYSVDEFLMLSENDQAKAVIKDDFIPISYMMDCMNASAIIVRNGTPLSHVAQTAKSLKVPFKIEN
ncbi:MULTISPECIES: hypothetical protein [Vibrio]|uniref:hypothetical protein n=1 Tax=Vibrio TaxID=662 RepID=UPI001A2DEFAE|nr:MULTISPECIES: hypothetical protein [Vibrio]MCA2471771.1 hypothetical protein [Vibrio alginolyticus]MDW2151792.1 hypothetical protein [Vibrio sp. 2092]HAT8521126.1 hypothetical protein [Vibrio vulnificus]